MSRPREKNNYVNPATIVRIQRHCYGAIPEFYRTQLQDRVLFDLVVFRAMMRGDNCLEANEKSLYIRLAEIEEEMNAQPLTLVDEGQVQWAVEMFQGPNGKPPSND